MSKERELIERIKKDFEEKKEQAFQAHTEQQRKGRDQSASWYKGHEVAFDYAIREINMELFKLESEEAREASETGKIDS